MRHCCKECGGSSICPHDKLKAGCAECNNCPCTIDGCPMYGHRFAGARSLLGHMRTSHAGDRKALTKVKERELYQALQAAGIQFDYQKHIPFTACGLGSETACAYADFVITTPWGYTFLECDEEQHSRYPVQCDVRRDFDIRASVTLGTNDKIKIIHYNPDSFRFDGEPQFVSKASRIARLLDVLPEEPMGFERIFMFYDSTSDNPLPLVAVNWQNGGAIGARVA